ncbi:MAG: pyridoxamine 5'-phosphate oxidase family protein [Defluviitaleaceae bacterium]|nr:pyridoxamine 5'-phosphate oxidase family protein [Defluviitaleaceae bacterium]
MSQEIVKRASELINSKSEYKAGGMEGYAALSLIDDNGYPSATTFCITRADGIKWLTFNTATDREYAKRISKNNKACVCINSSEYTINLVGTAEALTDMETRKENWLPMFEDGVHWSGPDDPTLLIIHFTTQRYTITFADDGSYAAGNIE